MVTIQLASNTIIDKSQITACQSIITNDKNKMYLIYECAVEEYYYNSDNDMYIFNSEININEVPYYNLILNFNPIGAPDYQDSILIYGYTPEELANEIKTELDKFFDSENVNHFEILRGNWDIENLHGENLLELENEIREFL